MDHSHMHHTEPIWSMNLFVGLLALSIGYLLFIRFADKSTNNVKRTGNLQLIAFFLAIFLFYVTFGSPMAAHTHHYLSIHMLQMSMISFIIPPLLVYSLPERLLQKFIPLLKYPIAGVVFFAILFSSYHVPPVFDWLMSSHSLHLISHFILFGAALIMWLPVTPNLAGAVLGTNERKYMHYVMWLVMPACIFLLIMNVELYATLDLPGKIFSNLTDQRLSGAIMIALHQVAMVINAWANRARTANQPVHWNPLRKMRIND